MYRTFTLFLLVCGSLVLGACTKQVPWKPEIAFLGIATGSLATPLDKLQFRNYFSPKDRELIAVVAFKEPIDGMQVQATWFQPDDRNAPLGRSVVTTQSGAAVARFSFASKEDWRATPFMLWIDAQAQRGKIVRTTTGSLHFFMGMTPAKAEAYRKDYTTYKSLEAKQRQQYEHERMKEEDMIKGLKDTLQSENLQIIGRIDLDGDDAPEYIIIETEQPNPFSALAGVLASASTKAFAITNQSGAVFLSFSKQGSATVLTSNSTKIDMTLPPADTAVTFHLLASKTILMTWESRRMRCVSELIWEKQRYVLRSEECTESKKPTR